MLKIINNYGVFLIIYIIPLMVFIFYSLKNNFHKSLIIIFSFFYLLLCVMTSTITYNVFPFIIVVSSMILIDRLEKDTFSFNGFNIFKALKYAIFSYLISLVISFLYNVILMSINLKILTTNTFRNKRYTNKCFSGKF